MKPETEIANLRREVKQLAETIKRLEKDRIYNANLVPVLRKEIAEWKERFDRLLAHHASQGENS